MLAFDEVNADGQDCDLVRIVDILSTQPSLALLENSLSAFGVDA